ncbi:hypothetical protein [Streptomyces sp. NPDC002054]|uniref:hypothetical protein n=1 Tax=Streptomyces sp. NPDC002054 TaxID=3154663 RepID=UPI00332F9F91
MSDDEAAAWQQWHERRVDTVSAPYGPLALTGNHWLADYPEGRIPAVPGQWRESGGSAARQAFAGIEATPYDPASVRFRRPETPCRSPSRRGNGG